MQPRIMYIERWGGLGAGVHGDARLGLVSFSQTGATLYYGNLSFRRVRGYKVNYHERDSGESYWISGPRRDGNDALYPLVIEVDAEVRTHYWTDVRGQPENQTAESFRSCGKHTRRKSRIDHGTSGRRRRRP